MTDYLARIHGHYASGARWGTSLHVSSSDTASILLTAWAAAVSDFWTNGSHGVNTFYPTGTILDSVDVVTLDDATGNQIARTTPTVLSLPGTSADTGLPDRNSVHVSLRGTAIGPGTLGGMRLPAPVEGTVTSGEFTSSLTTRVGTAARALLSAVGSDGSVVYIWNRQPTLHKPTPLSKTTMTTAECSSKVCVVSARTKGFKPSFG